MQKDHIYKVRTEWKGNLGSGTSGYRAYSRNHEIAAEGKQSVIQASSDPAFRGDSSRYNPEELLVSSLSSCHMLWVLHLCADADIVVTEYKDTATGQMVEHADGGGEFTKVTLHPEMVITDSEKIDAVKAIHEKAHHLCFIARSVNFPVECVPKVLSAAAIGQQ